MQCDRHRLRVFPGILFAEFLIRARHDRLYGYLIYIHMVSLSYSAQIASGSDLSLDWRAVHHFRMNYSARTSTVSLAIVWLWPEAGWDGMRLDENGALEHIRQCIKLIFGCLLLKFVLFRSDRLSSATSQFQCNRILMRSKSHLSQTIINL